MGSKVCSAGTYSIFSPDPLSPFHPLSSSSDNQQRDLVKLSSRQVVADDESEALKLPSLSGLSSIASLASSGVDIVEQLFGQCV